MTDIIAEFGHHGPSEIMVLRRGEVYDIIEQMPGKMPQPKILQRSLDAEAVMRWMANELHNQNHLLNADASHSVEYDHAKGVVLTKATRIVKSRPMVEGERLHG